MSVEEAKKVSASFTGTAFVPPPRTTGDITALLTQQIRNDPQAGDLALAKLSEPVPETSDPRILAKFFYDRGVIAFDIGRSEEAVVKFNQALKYAKQAGRPDYRLLSYLGWAESRGGSFTRAVAHLHEAELATPADDRGWLFAIYDAQAVILVGSGNLPAAEKVSSEIVRLLREARRWPAIPPGVMASFRARAATVQATVLEARGKYREAEALYRTAMEEMSDPSAHRGAFYRHLSRARMANTLVQQGRLLEAEVETRTALLEALRRNGRYSLDTAWMLSYLSLVVHAEGRYSEAEALAREALEICERIGTGGTSAHVAASRSRLGEALQAQGRSQEAVAQFEAINAGLINAPEFQGELEATLSWGFALLGTGRASEALVVFQKAFGWLQRVRGAEDPSTAEVRGALAMVYRAQGDRARALDEFTRASQVLFGPPSGQASRVAAPRWDLASRRVRAAILSSYIGLLAEIRGTPLEAQAGTDSAAEAFRLADAARGQGVQSALNAAAARAAVSDPALADLVRREQDAANQVEALYGTLANALSQPSDSQNSAAVNSLRRDVETLRQAQQTLSRQIALEFPAHAQLINPRPTTLDQARTALRPGEALIATYVGSDRTFVWAVPQTGPVVFAGAPLGTQQLGAMVMTLRNALDSGARTLGEIPTFDVSLAYDLYHQLLDPVRAGWEQAGSLLVVPHGPLAQLPIALLPTRPTILGPEQGALFSNYRAVPWLVRSHAVTVLPSVTSLSILRAMPPADPKRRPFVGFGDPYFSEEQARRAAAEEPAREPLATDAVALRRTPVTLRASPQTQALDSSHLAQLPRLPETAEEIRSLARALHADPTTDVFLGVQANERTVRSLNLARYRVLAFATHGLVPGDLDGLTQPALALTAPEVAHIDGNGLLTMDKILGLRLNTDWVVLSACNTASGQGAGWEAISGLGRAFFYAGARALLVSNWPVETTSARTLTTDLFRRQAADPKLTRAQALQQTLNALIDSGGYVDPQTKQTVFSYAHPIFWAPFTLVGDGG
jgi:CHAT domain-containing protein